MMPGAITRGLPQNMYRQRGISLFFAMIGVLVLSLAAVALIRAVDTGVIVAGNLAFKQAATAGGDSGVEAAINWLNTTQAANNSKNILTDSTHDFNKDSFANGYYSSTNPGPDIYASSTWAANNSVAVNNTPNPITGNSTRYIIQRICRNGNQAVQTADCLFSGAVQDTNGQAVPLPQEICKGTGCPSAGQSPQMRITSRTTGPRNSVSYVQVFVY
jgi:Tfp pilus assembly protein PilX